MIKYKKMRVSLSLPENLVEELNTLVLMEGFETRSQAVAEMIESQITEVKQRFDDEVMAGTITLIYDRSKNFCQQKISDIQYHNALEVISSLAINLEEHQVMEVILIQGPASKLKAISNQLLAIKGVKTGKLNLYTSILPPLHKRKEIPLPAEEHYV